MAIPNANGLTTANLDQASDNPSKARSDLAKLMQKVRELLESVDQAGGIVKLDADAQIEIARLFKVGSELQLTKQAGQGNVLTHTNTPETSNDVTAGTGEAIKRVKVDASGHVVRVESGDVTSLTGPFYSKWYFSHYEEVNRKSLSTKRPSNFNDDILTWVPGVSEHLPAVSDYLSLLAAGNVLSRLQKEALANVSGTRFSTTRYTNHNPISGVTTITTTYYETTIKPYRARYAHYTVT